MVQAQRQPLAKDRLYPEWRSPQEKKRVAGAAISRLFALQAVTSGRTAKVAVNCLAG